MKSLFLAPHNDDEALFGAFTILREHPLVAVVFDAHAQAARGAVTVDQRRFETIRALDILGAQHEFLGFSDIDHASQYPAICAAIRVLGQFDRVYAPAVEIEGHAQHNLVGHIADQVFGAKVTHYMTYTVNGKSRGREVAIEDGAWIGKKLRALACYESQHAMDSRIGCWPHFTRDLLEYYL